MCVFCEQFKSIRNAEDIKENSNHEWLVKLIEHKYVFPSKTNNEKEFQSFQLNYCPVCGKQLNVRRAG